MKEKNIGSSLDSWLRKEGIYDGTSANAIKRVVARQVEAAMQEKGTLQKRDGPPDAHKPRCLGQTPRSLKRCGNAQHAAKGRDRDRARNPPGAGIDIAG